VNGARTSAIRSPHQVAIATTVAAADAAYAEIAALQRSAAGADMPLRDNRPPTRTGSPRHRRVRLGTLPTTEVRLVCLVLVAEVCGGWLLIVTRLSLREAPSEDTNRPAASVHNRLEKQLARLRKQAVANGSR
jgi:hypothetical protein